jgi:hypothetical protein
MERATQITGLCRQTIMKAAKRGDIPEAFKRMSVGGATAPWCFTVRGLRDWLGIPDGGES